MPTLGAKDYSCAVSSYGQVFTDPWEKFFSHRFAACDVGLRPSPNHPAASEKKYLVPRVSKLCNLQKQARDD